MSEQNSKIIDFDGADDLVSRDMDLEDVENITESKEAGDDNVIVPKSKINLINKILHNARENNNQLIELLSIFADDINENNIKISQTGEVRSVEAGLGVDGGSVIEGVFDGEKMIGPDGKQYSVPVNYASKSKLVEGDVLKLIITSRGTFVYKQIKPIERNRIVAVLEQDEEGNYYAVSDGKKWKLLTASVTYFKGQSGDEAIVLVPRQGHSKWGAVENIVRK